MAYKSRRSRILKCISLVVLFCLYSLCAWQAFNFTEYWITGVRSGKTSSPAWKTVLPLWLYVYSAYASLNPENTASATIIITAITNRKTSSGNATVQCGCLYRDVLVDAEIKHSLEHHDMDYTAATILCDMTHSLFKNPAFLELRCEVGNISGSVELYVPESPSKNQSRHDFGICGPTVFGTDIQPEHVIEFVEYYQLMGVAKYVFYPYDSSSADGILHSNATADLMKVLRYYERLGRFHLENWSLPADIEGKVHYNGQIATLNDCMLKVAGYWSYAVVVDFDEYIISRNGAGLQSIMETQARDCCIVRSSVARSPLATLKSPFRRIPRNIIRESHVWTAGVRSKYICRPEKVVAPGIHFAHQTRPNTMVSVADPNETLVLHFNGATVPQHDSLVSLDIAEFLGLARHANYIENLLLKHKDIFNGSEIRHLTEPVYDLP